MLLVGVLWIVAMTYICYRGIEVSANFQKALLSIELVMLLVLSVVALVKVYNGHPGSIHPSITWFNPFKISDFSAFTAGVMLMVFIYWGWDTAVAVNEETKDKTKTPGRAAIISTFILLVTYALVIISIQAFAGVGTKGNGLGNPDNFGDVLSVQGNAIFGGSGIGPFFLRLLFLMILSSAAASTQTTILPTARTTLSMAAYKALPTAFAKIHPRHLTPTVSTITMGGISIVLYAVMNYLSAGTVIADAVTGIGLCIAFYYGLTGFACAWYYRREPDQQRAQPVDAGHPAADRRAHPVRARRLEPLAGLRLAPTNSYTVWTLPSARTGRSAARSSSCSSPPSSAGSSTSTAGRPRPPFFKKETLTRATPTLVPDE